MKKLILMMMLLMLVFGTASVIYAADEASTTTAVVAGGETKITLAGELRFRGEFSSNLKDQLNDGKKRWDKTTTPAGFSGGSDDHNAYYDGRVRLSIDAKIGSEVEGFVELESGSNNTDIWGWGNAKATDTGARGIFPEGNTKKGELFIRQAWIKYTKSLYGLKVGHMPLILGNGLFFDHTKFGDDAIVVFADPNKYVHVGVLAIKLNEQGTNHPDDGDAYVALVTYKDDKGLNLSGDITYVNDQGFSALIPTYNYAHIWNFAIRGDYMFGAATLRGDLEVQAGKFRGIGNVQDATVDGWAGLLGLDYKLSGGVPVKLTLEGAYGSGKASDDTSKDVKTFITSLGNDQHYTFVYEYKLKSAAGANNTGLANTLYLKGGAKAEFTKALDGELNIYWLQAAKKVALNGGTTVLGAPSVSPSRDLGWEIDTKITYKIAKNLKYFVEGGYMFTGKSYDSVVQTRAAGPAGPATYSIERNDAYAIRNGIQLNF
ncbi:MAG: alginate export family protein [Nitrospirae bacterium]|nr:alginate export family protein [Nitrospirota bacterium]